MQLVYGEWDFSGLFSKGGPFSRIPESRWIFVRPDTLPNLEMGFMQFTDETLIYPSTIVEKNGETKVRMQDWSYELLYVGYIQSVWPADGVHWSTKYLKQVIEAG